MAGIYLFTLNSFGLLFSQFFKMSACIYRPWVLSDKIKPIDSALHFAGGYSFPSGHCGVASTSFGGLAFLFAKKHKFLCVLLVLLILLVGFSRIYVGVHTPQDVVVGLLIGLVLVFAINYLIKWCEKDKNRFLYLMCVVNILVFLLFYYVIAKDYPIDYLNGEVLVKPQKGIYITILYCGWVFGIVNGAMLCKRFFPFEPKNMSVKSRIIVGAIGLISVIFLMFLIERVFFDDPKPYWITFISLSAIGFWITGLYPLIFRKFLK